MESVPHSFLLVAAAEMGDKTQLLAFVLASRFQKPWAVLGGILVATVLNHLLAAWFGGSVAGLVPEPVLRWVLAATFWAFAIWILVPDREEESQRASRYGAFATTLVSFFLAEMGDKTQLATVALAARFREVAWVSFGTTLGMLFSDGLAVFLGERLTRRISMRWVRRGSAALFALFGAALALGL